MKLSFLSNYYTHHQKPVCQEWDRLTDHSFAFIATENFSREQQEMGWPVEENVPFVADFREMSPEDVAEYIDSCETLIMGSVPLKTVQTRLRNKKIVLKYSERVFRNGYQPLKWLPRICRYWWRYGRHKSLYLLSSSAYTAVDFAIHGTFIGKSYRWGYFPETKRYDVTALMAKKDPVRILWCGRFLALKHPDDAIEVARRLKAEGYVFQLDMIGAGEMEETLKSMVREYNLSDCVELLGAMPTDAVRVHMERAGIYLFTSDFREGWGAVLNESMNSGCAVVASHGIGSVPFLMKHRKNGLIYPNGNIDKLYQNVKFLLDHPEEQQVLGAEAYHTIADLWNAEIAAQRLLCLTREIQDHGYCDLYEDGPCSKAPIIRNGWFKG